jgi:hypothetical protein
MNENNQQHIPTTPTGSWGAITETADGGFNGNPEQSAPVQEPDMELMHEPSIEVLRQQMKGRAQFLRDRGEVKTPQLLEIASEFITPPAAQPAPVQPVQEPVAWINTVTGDLTMQDMSHTVSWAPLYATPPAALENIEDAITALKDGWVATALNTLEEARLHEMTRTK